MCEAASRPELEALYQWIAVCQMVGNDEAGLRDTRFDQQIVRDSIYRRRRLIEHVSGHSTRVGAAQNLAELDIDFAAITQAGGWKSPRMPLQYAEKINVARSGMARAAAAAG